MERFEQLRRERLRPQEVLQMFLFEHLLLRLEKTSYVDKFILKGGLLISSMIGVSLRTTMDMDTTVVGIPLDRDSIEQTMEQICSVDVGDGMEYIFERVESIRTDDEYPNWRAHIMGLFAFKGVGGVGIRRSGGGSVGGSFGG